LRILAAAAIQIPIENGGISILAKQDQGVGQRLERRIDPRLQRLADLRIVVVHARYRIERAVLNDRSVPDFAEIEACLGFPCFLEVVMQGSVKDGELDPNVVEVLACGIVGILPVLSAAEDVGRVGSLADMVDKVADERDVDAIVRIFYQRSFA
jgi:hypothetical protein